MTHEEVEELIARRVAEEMEAREVARNLEALNENEEEQEGENGGNENGGNGGNRNGDNEGNGNEENGNEGNGNHGMNYEGFVPMARECTFQYFLKCKPHTFSGTEGVNNALTWWNSHKRTIGVDVAYAMKWARLMKLMTEVYCPRNEVQKMEAELWNLTVKVNDLTAYIQRFQELILLCTRMIPNEEDRVERFIGGLPDNIQGNVIAANPARLQDAIRIANHLIDKKLQATAIQKAKCQWAELIQLGTMKERGMHHEGLCTIRCGNCKKNRGNQTRNKTGGNEVTARAYAISGGGINTDSNIVTGHPFDIDLMPVELGSFDVIIGMDWLAKYHALIVCEEKVVRIPYGNEVLIIRGDNCDGGSKLNIISYTKTQKYIQKGCQVYLAQVTSKKAEDKLDEKRLEDDP
nr:hypothetical protein [Tanacetum cinerariifolium]